jgi:YggT family protein
MGFLILPVSIVFKLYYVLFILRAVLPWIPHNKEHALLRPVYQLTDPFLAQLKAALPPARIGADVSPFLAIFLLYILQKATFYILYKLIFMTGW